MAEGLEDDNEGDADIQVGNSTEKNLLGDLLEEENK